MAKYKSKREADELYQAIAKRLMFCRKSLKLTLKEVAEGSGLSLSSYSSKEYGMAARNIDDYRKITEFLASKWRANVYDGKVINKLTVNFIIYGEVE